MSVSKNLLGKDDDLTNLANVGAKKYAIGAWNVPEQSFFKGWLVGHRKNKDSKGIDILSVENQSVSNANTESIGTYEAMWAVRLWAHDSDYAGEISHSIPLEQGKKYTLTWYDSADYFDHQGGAENYSVYLNRIAGVIPDGSESEKISSNYVTSQRGWVKKSITLDMTEKRGGTYHISFMGPLKKFNNSIRRGVLITNVILQQSEPSAGEIDISLVDLSIMLEKGGSNSQGIKFEITNRGTDVDMLEGSATITNKEDFGVHLRNDPYISAVKFSNKKGYFIIRAGELLAGNAIGQKDATLTVTIGAAKKEFKVNVKERVNWFLVPLEPARNQQPIEINERGTGSIKVKLLDDSQVGKAAEMVALSINHNNEEGALSVRANGGKTDETGCASFILEGNKTTQLPVEITVKHPRVPEEKWLKFPVTVNSASAEWTVSGTMPSRITTPTKLKLTLLKNNKKVTKKETLNVTLDTDNYLSVDRKSLETDEEGTFSLVLTPKSGQSGLHSTTLTLSHSGRDIAHYVISTSTSSTAQYEIRVQDANLNFLDLTRQHTWSDTDETYVNVTVVNKNTAEEAASAMVSVTSSDTKILAVKNASEIFRKGAPARFNMSPATSGTVLLTFSSLGADNAVLRIKLGKKIKGSLESNSKSISLTPGISRTLTGELAPIDIRFNPPFSGGVPPDIEYLVEGHDELFVIKNNKRTVSGSLTPVDPDNSGDYRIQPQLSTTQDASKSGKIRFQIRGQDDYADTVVSVNIRTVDHVTWSVSENPVKVDAGRRTTLNLRLKALDLKDLPLSAYALDVNIIAKGEARATFAGKNSTRISLSEANAQGWASLPELDVNNSTGRFSLSAHVPGGATALPSTLEFLVKNSAQAANIIMHPNTSQAFDFRDLTDGILFGSGQYAQLNDAGNNHVSSGTVKFSISSQNNSAQASIISPSEVPVNTLTGRAMWPKIRVQHPGTFTLIASTDTLVSQGVTFIIS